MKTKLYHVGCPLRARLAVTDTNRRELAIDLTQRLAKYSWSGAAIHPTLHTAHFASGLRVRRGRLPSATCKKKLPGNLEPYPPLGRLLLESKS